MYSSFSMFSAPRCVGGSSGFVKSRAGFANQHDERTDASNYNTIGVLAPGKL